MKTLKMLEFAFLSSACWLTKWRNTVFQNVIPPNGRRFIWNFFLSEENTNPIHTYKFMCSLLSLSPASLEVIVSLIKNNFSVFSLNRIALASSWTLLFQLAPQSCTFIISFKIQTPQFLSHLVFQNIILLVPLDPSQFSCKQCSFHSPLQCGCALLCMTLSCILLPLTDTPFSLCIPLSWTQALVSPLSWWLSNLYLQPSLMPIWTSPLESTWMFHEPLHVKSWILPSHKPLPLLVFPISVGEYNFETADRSPTVILSFSLSYVPQSCIHLLTKLNGFYSLCTYRIWLTACALVGIFGASCLAFCCGVLTGCSTFILALL